MGNPKRKAKSTPQFTPLATTLYYPPMDLHYYYMTTHNMTTHFC